MILLPCALLVGGLVPPAPTTPQDDPPALELVSLSFPDALSRAERLEKMLVVLWCREDDPRSAAIERDVLGDPEVRSWIAKHAVAARIDVDENEADARRNRIGVLQIPCIDIISVLRGGRVDRLVHGAESIDFLAAVLGQTDGDVPARPEGDAATEPFRWMAWGNHCFKTPGPEASAEVVLAYDWCLKSAEAFRPGFRTRYFEFLVRRLLQCRARNPRAEQILGAELKRIGLLLNEGRGTRRDAYEYTRLVEWLDGQPQLRALMKGLSAAGDDRRRERLWLLPDAAPVLGRFEEYGPILDTVQGDAVPIFEARIHALRSALAAARPVAAGAMEGGEDEVDAAPDAAPLDDAARPFLLEALAFTRPDTQADLVLDASWVFEALLAGGRRDQAIALQALVAEQFTTAARVYTLFVERALRRGDRELASAIADVGMANLSGRGRQRLQRILDRMAADDGK